MQGCVHGISYKSYQELETNDHYSFEYPDNFSVTIRSGYNFQEAMNTLELTNNVSDTSRVQIHLTVRQPTASETDVEAVVNNMLSDDSYCIEKVLERSKGKISGIPCELFTARLNWHETIFYGTGSVFIYNGRLWNLGVSYLPDNEKPAREIFKHVFDTFKLLP
jgi:hypothetical protein